MLITELRSKEEETIKALGGPAIMTVTGGSGVLKAQGKS